MRTNDHKTSETNQRHRREDKRERETKKSIAEVRMHRHTTERERRSQTARACIGQRWLSHSESVAFRHRALCEKKRKEKKRVNLNLTLNGNG